MDAVVLTSELIGIQGQRWGHIQLNSPKNLNAISLAIVDLIQEALNQWEADDCIIGVFMDAVGEKGFCAGGDIVSLYHDIRKMQDGHTVLQESTTFFSREYRLDYHIHHYRKPILCWGHGYVMGGGMGLMNGCSHRVITPATCMAMPEISIGLFPDVLASWFLQRVPGQIGLFMGLTAARLSPADARFAGLADFLLPNEDKSRILATLEQTTWADNPAVDGAKLSNLLRPDANASAEMQGAKLLEHYELIETVIGHGDDLHAIDQRLRALVDHEDAWLASCAQNYVSGSPTSAVLIHQLWQRCKKLSLAEIARLEYCLTLACCLHHDFAEGVRALLIDKDKTPHWQYARISELPDCLINAHFQIDDIVIPELLAELR